MSATPPHARLALGVLAAALLALSTQGCIVHHHTQSRYGGPPPQAPAHGYYYDHDGVTLVFEKSLDSYVVENHTHHYYHRSRYYRFADNGWQMAVRIGGPWNVVAVASVPVSLRGRHKVVRHDRHDAYRQAAKEYRKDQKASAKERHQVAKDRRKDQKKAADGDEEEETESATANQSDW
jgi:hypothetical protein